MFKLSQLRRWLIGLSCWMICAAASALEINQANEAELDNLKGMGPALSRHVLKARAEGEFQSWADVFQRVSGMGPGKAKQFSSQGLTVNGQAFPEAREPKHHGQQQP
ncbi:helix-hairpin-helix domain-containing protein [Limnohabitans sp. TS-CS-82]|uniref:ComEA family DNA-binding protein n=1 Tax=Limnohabitans sp. TS-CS-82 TaxID=2094193 RepID=UPI001F3A8D2E|nr:helix-hairpin-helix domain-containing protein [Limnohabitans sp. TS-CS-82]